MAEKKIFWEGSEKDYNTGKYTGVLLNPEDIEDKVWTDDVTVFIWDNKKESDAPEIPTGKIEFEDEEYESFIDFCRENYNDTIKDYLDILVGEESRWGSGWESADNSLSWDDQCKEFGATENWEVSKTYSYFCNTNYTTISLGEDETEYELEITDSYNLDYLHGNSTNFEYGGMGEHSILHKVIVDGDVNDVRLFWQDWSQWQGSELDSGYFITVDEALDELENHPELEEITVWLGIKEDAENK